MILKVCLVVVLATIIGLVALQIVDPNLNTSPDTKLVIDDKNSFTVGISGEVFKPGDYVFNTTATMEDLLAASGGPTTNSDDRCYYLEAEVDKNITYYIPPKYDNTDICSEDPIVKTNINSASIEELMEISGFGETLATSIVSYRQENGIFYTLESLMNVSGIGNAKFNVCKNYIILHD